MTIDCVVISCYRDASLTSVSRLWPALPTNRTNYEAGLIVDRGFEQKSFQANRKPFKPRGTWE
jgi:hypothetical protein